MNTYSSHSSEEYRLASDWEEAHHILHSENEIYPLEKESSNHNSRQSSHIPSNSSDEDNEFYTEDNYFVPDVIVKLNVGGKIYHTMSNTLMGSLFFENLLMYSIQTYNKIMDDKEIFINRNGRLFEYIFQNLVTKNTNYLPTHLPDLLQLKCEAEYYRIQELKEAVEQRVFALCTTQNTKQQRTYRVLPRFEFEQIKQAKSYKTGQRSTLMDEYEVITTVETQEPYWVCPRTIKIHTSSSMCSKACKRVFDPDHHGWQFVETEKVIIATRDE
ncbi:hypothetical protein G6F56_001372 [Rhizopus delemar]|uniref:Potassium channel tetramerisation-type BTB domain-containing protein n=1 Tax=Rhizopus stolonifer TaxID=4846 RepID=A0A367JSE2_RHIST|nr:hypothetical protein G6F56_001372 [Rhizopus delemar]RCH92769.1 hypothetical protein CU098_008757 [Rhizopus stolonifer]